MTPVLDPRQVANTNQAVDVEKLTQMQNMLEILQKAGVVKKADYRISPSLGSGPAQLTAPPNTVVRLHSFSDNPNG